MTTVYDYTYIISEYLYNIFSFFSQVKIWFQNKRSKFKKIYKTHGPAGQLAADAELSGEMQSSLGLMVSVLFIVMIINKNMQLNFNLKKKCLVEFQF